MNIPALATVLTLALLNAALLGVLIWKASKAFSTMSDQVRTELRSGRDEARLAAREVREEVVGNVQRLDDAVRHSLDVQGTRQGMHHETLVRHLQEFAEAQQSASIGFRTMIESAAKELRVGTEGKLEDIRREVQDGLKANIDLVTTTLDRTSSSQQAQVAELNRQYKEIAEGNQQSFDRIRDTFSASLRDLREGNDRKLDEVRSNVAESLASGAAVLDKGLQAASDVQREQLDALTRQMKELSEYNERSLERIRASLETSVKTLQASTEQRLEEMRKTVDEKLHDTLEKRLGESFKQVSDRLETVHKGLGEMQTLASGVGDLKRVLTNVKVRGTWAEVQLGAILEQILIPEQWDKNVCVREDSLERVEFAVRLPGSKSDPNVCMWLPIDSKFPKEDYLRLQAAAEAGDAGAVQGATDPLLRELRRAAKEIHEKYVNPPTTTDFAIMFLATEGLFSEALRQPAFVEELQQRYRVIIAGPTNLAAILSSLRMGFQTLAVEQRAAEVWRVLGAVKTEFGKFGSVLDRVKRQLATASRTIEETGTRSRVMERQLRSVEQLSPVDTAAVLALSAPTLENEEVSEEEVALD